MRPTIDEVRGLGDFATLYHWIMRFFKFPNVGQWPADTLLDLHLISSSLPVTTNTKASLKIRGHQVHQPGTQEYSGTIVFTMAETVDNIVSRFYRQWREACWLTREGKQGAKADVEAGVILTRLNRQNDPIWAYKLYGVWMESYTVPDVDGETPDIMKPALTLSYDYFEEEEVGSGSSEMTVT